VADLLDMSPYDLTLEWMAREAFISEAAGEMRRYQSGAQGPAWGTHRFTWQVN
tara:strand:- start:669 stop:827 length:159 start_codon:yes stop_codon:yes gene_type:complete